MNKMKEILRVIGFVLICQMAGIIGAEITVNSVAGWYMRLFGPVWTILYTLMGIGVYLIWKKSKDNKLAKKGVKVFFMHLLLNAIWSPVFFGLKQIFLALVIILAIWAMIVWLIVLWGKMDKRASWLLVPYLAWVSFASLLNLAILWLN